MERQEPVHRLGRRRPVGQGRRRGRARRRSCSPTAGVLPDVLHTSVLRRAIRTAQVALDACDRHWVPVRRSWRLNERHYGALQGKDKKATLEAYGEEQFMLWRRSYDVPPPPIDRRRRVQPDRRPALRRPAARAAAAHRVPGRRRRPDAAVLVRRDRARPAHRRDRAGHRARQLAARAGEAPRRHLGRGHRRAQHPDRHPAASTSSTPTCGRRCAAGSTSTPTRRPTRSRPSPTKGR